MLTATKQLEVYFKTHRETILKLKILPKLRRIRCNHRTNLIFFVTASTEEIRASDGCVN